jgi:hypothetical protein
MTIVQIGSLTIRQQFGLAETLTDNFKNVILTELWGWRLT